MPPIIETQSGWASGLERQLIADLTERSGADGRPARSSSERVADALREQIGSGKLKPGARLISEVALAQKLEISRPTLREAIRILGREGLLNIKHGVGTFVAKEHQPDLGSLEPMRSMTDLIRSVGGVPGDSHLKIAWCRRPNDGRRGARHRAADAGRRWSAGSA